MAEDVRLYYDLDLGALVTKPLYSSRLSSASFKRGDSAVIEVLFYKEGELVQLDGTLSEMVFAVKEDFEEATDPMILANAFTYDSDTKVYSAEVTGDSAAILLYLNGAASKAAKGELTFTTSTLGTDTSQTLSVTLYNDVWKGTEGTPLSLPTPDSWLAARAPLYSSASPTYTFDFFVGSFTANRQIAMPDTAGIMVLSEISGSLAPDVAPAAEALLYVKTDGRFWISKGVSSTADWRELATLAGYHTYSGNNHFGGEQSFNDVYIEGELELESSATFNFAETARKGLLAALFPNYSSLANANAALAPGVVFWNTTTELPEITTA